MPGYVPKAFTRFGHERPQKLQDQPYKHTLLNYGAKLQYGKAIYNQLPLSKGDKTFVMQVTGTLLFYSRSIDITMVPDLSAISSEQNSPTKNTMKHVKQFLDYATSQEGSIVTFNASVTVLAIRSDASSLFKNYTRSCAGDQNYLSNDEEN